MRMASILMATASPAARWLNAEADCAGRVKVGADLSLPGHPDIFMVGDTATVTDAKGNPVPGIAPAAKQMGQYVGKLIAARIAGRAVPLHAPRRTGDHRTPRCGGEIRPPAAAWLHRLGVLERGAHLLPDRIAQPLCRRLHLVLGLFDVSARRAADHRSRRSEEVAGTLDANLRSRDTRIFSAGKSAKPGGDHDPSIRVFPRRYDAGAAGDPDPRRRT